jgi:small GTP-binding protein
MIQKKVCLLGASAVGKTSLVSRFVRGVFHEKYLTTVGVKIDQRQVSTPAAEFNLVIWDLNGEDRFQPVQTSYLRGMGGYLLVADGTRSQTLETALELHERVLQQQGKLPHVLLLNKSDLVSEWNVDAATEARLNAAGFTVMRTSARDGSGVAEAFIMLTSAMGFNS